MAHGVVRTDKMYGTDVRSGMVSVKVTETDGIDNGCVAILGGLADKGDIKEREVYEITEPTAGGSFDAVILIATPELNADPRKYALDNFFNENGSIARGYRLHNGDIFSVTADALNGVSDSTEIGDIVELMAGYTLKVVSSATQDSTTIGKIIDIEVVGGLTFYVIEVAA